MRVVQTSEREIGQVYMPAVNRAQLVVVAAAVLAFGSSTNLAAAYGIAVAGTMLTTTLLTFFVIRHKWHYHLLLCLGATGFFLAIDLAFLGANSLKIASGGWLLPELSFGAQAAAPPTASSIAPCHPCAELEVQWHHRKRDPAGERAERRCAARSEGGAI